MTIAAVSSSEPVTDREDEFYIMQVITVARVDVNNQRKQLKNVN